jgi:pimeloyl-ACP methyl ester carboxylesterase
VEKRPVSNRTPLIFVPGLLCDAALWQSQVAALADIATPEVADVTRDESLEAMARRVLAAAPPRFALAGLSMGGYIAQEIMRQAPERVSRLALLDSSARADRPEQTERRHVLMALAEKEGLSTVTPQLWPLFVHPDRVDDAALRKEFMAMTERVGRDAFLRQQRAIIARPDGRAGLARIKVPTLVLCGREDVATPLALHEEMASLTPGAELVVIEHCGHLSTMERPAEVNAALRRWLLS